MKERMRGTPSRRNTSRRFFRRSVRATAYRILPDSGKIEPRRVAVVRCDDKAVIGRFGGGNDAPSTKTQPRRPLGVKSTHFPRSGRAALTRHTLMTRILHPLTEVCWMVIARARAAVYASDGGQTSAAIQMNDGGCVHPVFMLIRIGSPVGIAVRFPACLFECIDTCHKIFFQNL